MLATLIPAPPCETLVYDWYARHEAVKAHIKNNPIELVFIGDSITHCFGGQPESAFAVADDIWSSFYGRRRAVNLGFGWDRIQQMRWRLSHGELDGLAPKVAVIMAGGNNLLTGVAPPNTPEEIVAGLQSLCADIRQKTPTTKILLLAVFPRGKTTDDALRIGIGKINRGIFMSMQDLENITLLDITASFLNPDKTMSPEVMNDFVHPTAQGYRIWAQNMEPVLAALLADR